MFFEILKIYSGKLVSLRLTVIVVMDPVVSVEMTNRVKQLRYCKFGKPNFDFSLNFFQYGN